MLEKNHFLSFLAFCTMVQNLSKKHKKNSQKLEFQTWYRYRMLEKGTLHFNDFVGISKTYPLQSLKKRSFQRWQWVQNMGDSGISRFRQKRIFVIFISAQKLFWSNFRVYTVLIQYLQPNFSNFCTHLFILQPIWYALVHNTK